MKIGPDTLYRLYKAISSPNNGFKPNRAIEEIARKIDVSITRDFSATLIGAKKTQSSPVVQNENRVDRISTILSNIFGLSTLRLYGPRMVLEDITKLLEDITKFLTSPLIKLFMMANTEGYSAYRQISDAAYDTGRSQAYEMAYENTHRDTESLRDFAKNTILKLDPAIYPKLVKQLTNLVNGYRGNINHLKSMTKLSILIYEFLAKHNTIKDTKELKDICNKILKYLASQIDHNQEKDVFATHTKLLIAAAKLYTFINEGVSIPWKLPKHFIPLLLQIPTDPKENLTKELQRSLIALAAQSQVPSLDKLGQKLRNYLIKLLTERESDPISRIYATQFLAINPNPSDIDQLLDALDPKHDTSIYAQSILKAWSNDTNLKAILKRELLKHIQTYFKQVNQEPDHELLYRLLNLVAPLLTQEEASALLRFAPTPITEIENNYLLAVAARHGCLEAKQNKKFLEFLSNDINSIKKDDQRENFIRYQILSGDIARLIPCLKFDREVSRELIQVNNLTSYLQAQPGIDLEVELESIKRIRKTRTSMLIYEYLEKCRENGFDPQHKYPADLSRILSRIELDCSRELEFPNSH